MSLTAVDRGSAVTTSPSAGQVATPVRRWTTTAATLVAAVVAVSALSVLIGSRWIDPGTLFDSTHRYHAVALARFDRTILGLAVGGALGLVGALMQGLTRNPIADPGILGINAGASLAMVLGLSVLGITDQQLHVWLAFGGAAAAMLLVHGIAAFGRDGATPVKVAIAGAAITAGVTSWTTAILLTDKKTMESFRYWQVGTIGGRDLDLLISTLPFLGVGLLLGLTSMRRLNALALGDDVARGLGRRVGVDRAVLGTAIVLLAGCATALAGPIAFVGLMVPHAVRAMVGPDYRRVLPLSLLAGAALLVAADVLGRVILPPSEMQVGIMAALVGVPFFLALVRRGRIGSL